MPAREYEQRLATPVGGLILVWLDPADTGRPQTLTSRSREAVKNTIIHLQEQTAVKYECARQCYDKYLSIKECIQPSDSPLAGDGTDQFMTNELAAQLVLIVKFQYQGAYASEYARTLMDILLTQPKD